MHTFHVRESRKKYVNDMMHDSFYALWNWKTWLCAEQHGPHGFLTSYPYMPKLFMKVKYEKVKLHCGWSSCNDSWCSFNKKIWKISHKKRRKFCTIWVHICFLHVLLTGIDYRKGTSIRQAPVFWHLRAMAEKPMEVYYLDEWIIITLHVAGFLHPAIF